MLREAIEKIIEIAQPKIVDINGKTYASANMKEVRPAVDMPEALTLKSLDALVQMVKNDTAEILFVSVEAHNRVRVFGLLDEDNRYLRKEFYIAEASDVPGWDKEVKLPFDQASVALMTRFQDSEDREYALRLLSQITTGAKITYTDNGIASTIVTQKGAALAQNMTIRPLVRLRPYRTFQEVEQPEGIFLIRIDEKCITFTEADGGMWKLTARKTVKAWLEKELADAENVTVML